MPLIAECSNVGLCCTDPDGGLHDLVRKRHGRTGMDAAIWLGISTLHLQPQPHPSDSRRKMEWGFSLWFQQSYSKHCGKCLYMDTGCPLHVHMTLYTAYTVVKAGGGPTVRHLSL